MPNILIVDDEIEHIAYLSELLTHMGHQTVGVAITGEAAVENARHFQPDLILMDVTMPGKMDGIEASKIIRDELNIPVIFVTAHTEKELVDRAKQTHPAAYLIKPFREIELEVSIELAIFNSAYAISSAKDPKRDNITWADDVPDFQAIEKQMHKMIQAEAICSLSAAIAHQYNNTVMAITGYAQLIEIKYPEHQDLLACTRAIQQAAKRISTIVDQLSALTLQESKSFHPESICKLVQHVLSVVQQTSHAGVTWKIEVEPSNFLVLADSASLQLAIYSLLKHLTGTHGTRKLMIRVVCRSLILHELSTDTSENIQRGHYIYLKFQDEGFQAHDEGLEWTPNSFSIPSFSVRNMNMFAAYHIIQNHGGNLSLSHEEGKGISINVYFPAIPPVDS